MSTLTYFYMFGSIIAVIGIIYNLIAMQREKRLNQTGL